MSTAKKAEGYKSNTYNDEDMAAVIAEIEEMREEKADIMATARGKAMNVTKREKNRIKMAKQELGIPSDILTTLLKQRELERKMERLAEGVSDDMIEVYEDAAKSFGLFADTPLGEAAVAAAQKAAAQSREAHEAEQAEGQAALDELAKGAVH
jgi:hypothetical protein